MKGRDSGSIMKNPPDRHISAVGRVFSESALERNRTSDTGFRRAVLYPLSYQGVPEQTTTRVHPG